MGRGEPILGPSGIAFNGPRPMDYESFVFPGDGLIPGEGRYFGFCKTGFSSAQARPYDLGVKAALLLAKVHMGDALEVRTDGTLGEWARAAELVEGVLHLPVDLYGALGIRLLLMEDARGRRFLGEVKVGVDADYRERFAEALEAMRRMGIGLPLTPPFRILGSARPPVEELARLQRERGLPLYLL